MCQFLKSYGKDGALPVSIYERRNSYMVLLFIVIIEKILTKDRLYV